MSSDLRKRIEALWDQSGDCGSCGWHACLYEYYMSDEELASCVENGILHLPCLSKNDEDPSSHRGVRIHLTP